MQWLWNSIFILSIRLKVLLHYMKKSSTLSPMTWVKISLSCLIIQFALNFFFCLFFGHYLFVCFFVFLFLSFVCFPSFILLILLTLLIVFILILILFVWCVGPLDQYKQAPQIYNIFDKDPLLDPPHIRNNYLHQTRGADYYFRNMLIKMRERFIQLW